MRQTISLSAAAFIIGITPSLGFSQNQNVYACIEQTKLDEAGETGLARLLQSVVPLTIKDQKVDFGNWSAFGIDFEVVANHGNTLSMFRAIVEVRDIECLKRVKEMGLPLDRDERLRVGTRMLSNGEIDGIPACNATYQKLSNFEIESTLTDEIVTIEMAQLSRNSGVLIVNSASSNGRNDAQTIFSCAK